MEKQSHRFINTFIIVARSVTEHLERLKSRRAAPQTVSLNEPIPGGGGGTIGEPIDLLKADISTVLMDVSSIDNALDDLEKGNLPSAVIPHIMTEYLNKGGDDWKSYKKELFTDYSGHIYDFLVERREEILEKKEFKGREKSLSNMLTEAGQELQRGVPMADIVKKYAPLYNWDSRVLWETLNEMSGRLNSGEALPDVVKTYSSMEDVNLNEKIEEMEKEFISGTSPGEIANKYRGIQDMGKDAILGHLRSLLEYLSVDDLLALATDEEKQAFDKADKISGEMLPPGKIQYGPGVNPETTPFKQPSKRREKSPERAEREKTEAQEILRRDIEERLFDTAV